MTEPWENHHPDCTVVGDPPICSCEKLSPMVDPVTVSLVGEPEDNPWVAYVIKLQAPEEVIYGPFKNKAAAEAFKTGFPSKFLRWMSVELTTPSEEGS